MSDYFTDYGAGNGPDLAAGFGRRSTSDSSQTTTPSNPGPADSSGARRYDMGPEKITPKKGSPRTVKPVVAKKTPKKTRAQTRGTAKKR
jgi:hypothetical protein